MAEVYKGIVTERLKSGEVLIRPYGRGNALTPPLKTFEKIEKGQSVAFVMFEDATGFVLKAL